MTLIVDKTVKVEDLLIGDKNAIMVAARILGYGKDYDFTYDGEEQKVDLTTLKPIELDESQLKKGSNQFEYVLPKSERKITFKLLTGNDEKNIDAEVKAREKLGGSSTGELTTRLKNIITSIDGNVDRSYINNFVDNEFLALDTRAYRQYVDSITPDIELKFDYMSQTGNQHRLDVPLGIEFFWPAAGK